MSEWVTPAEAQRTTEALETLCAALARSQRARLVFITHGWGGGVERHVRDLLHLLRPHRDVLVLRGLREGSLELAFYGRETAEDASLQVGGFSAETLDAWVEALRALGCARVHVHHLHGWPSEVHTLIERLGLPIDITLHDYALISPRYHLEDAQGRYVGLPPEEDDQARAWRERGEALLKRAARVIAPSEDVARRYRELVPELEPLIWPHPEAPIRLPSLIKVALIGGLSEVKGFSVLLAVEAEARARGLPLAFRVIGHATRPLPPSITATGSYAEEDLPRLLALERADVYWFPAQVPETWNYALSAAIATGAPIVASDLGSHRQRLASYPQAQLLPHGASVEAWLEALLATRTSVASSAGAGCELASSGQHYEERYLVKDTVEAAPPSVEILARLLRSLPAPSAEPQPALIDLFRLGRYAGHTGSANAVESELAALPPGEVHVVGRRIFETIAEQRAELEQRLQTASELLSASEARAAELSEKAAALAGELALAEDRLEQTSATLSAQQSRLRQLEEELADQHHRARAAQRHIDHLEGELARILASRSWRWTRPLRGLARMARLTPSALRLALYALRERPALIARGFRYLRYRGVIATLNRLERERFRLGAADPPSSAPLQEARPAIRPLALPTSHEPRLSILIPVYGQHEVTFGLLESLAAHWPSLPTEVLIADDASPIPAAQALAPVRGLRILRHAQNFGFLGNVNAAVREARGEWLLLLNNDTRVTAGAIDALLATFDKHERVGLVAAKLLNADGTLQEAGGIVWQDGSAWNYGRGEHAEDPRFNFVREIDYGSGAALLLRRRLWDQLGGFDPTFSPAYYEDTDLAMRVREAGLRVLYQPHAEIYHLEGVSHGTDLSQGVKAYQALNERRFAERWRARLADHRPNGVAPEREALRGRIGTVLIVEACMLTPDQDSGSLRMFNLMRLMLREGRHVVFIADNLEGTQPYRRQLEDEGVEVVHGAWAGGSVQAYLKAHGARFDTVILCRHYVASPLLSAVRSYAPHARVIFDTVDLHHLRELREAELHGSPQMRASALRTQQAELALVRAVDTTWVVAPTEAERLRAACPTAHIEVVSNVHEPVPARAAFEQRRGVLFVGGFRHPPNVDAIRWYAEAVLPQLRRLAPGLRTQVVGSHVPEEIRALACRELEILGYVPDLQPLLQNARVSIAPLRYGAGVKGKINEAMNHGIPVVATSVAVEGMHLRDGEDCLIADDPAAFARAIVQVHEDAALWRRLSEAGRRNVERYFSPQAVLGALRRSLRTNASAPATEVAFETAETRANVA